VTEMHPRFQQTLHGNYCQSFLLTRTKSGRNPPRIIRGEMPRFCQPTLYLIAGIAATEDRGCSVMEQSHGLYLKLKPQIDSHYPSA
jgi:hypothetical protein